MLDINANFHCMQFQGKLMNQTWENGKKPSFGPDFGLFQSKFGSQKHFCGFYLYYTFLQAIIVCNFKEN